MTTIESRPFESNQRHGRRKSCGRELWQRVNEICQSRGGAYGYTFRRQRRVRRGIVNECCERECSDQDVITYCSNTNVSEPSESNKSTAANERSRQSRDEVDQNQRRISRPLTKLLHAVDKGNSIESIENVAVEATTIPAATTTTTGSIPNEWMNRFTVYPPNKQPDHQIWYKIYLMVKDMRQKDFEVGTVPPEYKSQPFLPSQYQFAYN